jgi:hypothetical protein
MRRVKREMITMKDLGRIRSWYYRDGMSIVAIMKKSGYARNTVKSWLKATEGTEPAYRRRPTQDSKIAPYAAQLTKELEADRRRPQRDRRTALKLFGEIKTAGFAGDYGRFSRGQCQVQIQRQRAAYSSGAPGPIRCRDGEVAGCFSADDLQLGTGQDQAEGQSAGGYCGGAEDGEAAGTKAGVSH